MVSRRKKRPSGNPARRGLSFQGRVVVRQFERWMDEAEVTFTDQPAGPAMLEQLILSTDRVGLDILSAEDAEDVIDLLLDAGPEGDGLLDVFHDYVHFRLETDEDGGWEDAHESLEGLLDGNDGLPAVLEDAVEEWELQDPVRRRHALANVRMVAPVRQLLEWVGSGRTVTDSGALRRADIAEVAKMLGIAARGVAKLPAEGEYRDGAIVVAGESHVQSMWDLPALSAWWEALRAADLVEVTRTRVRPGPAASEWLAEELPPLEDAGALVSVFTAQLLTFAQAGEPDAWTSALLRLTVLQAIDTLEPGAVDAAPDAIEDILLPRARRSLEHLADTGVLERSATDAFQVPELLRGPFARGIALSLVFLNDEVEQEDRPLDDAAPFSDTEVKAEMARLGIVHTSGMAADMMRELAPLLAEEGIDLDNLEADADLDTLNTALARATERRNLELFTPTGERRAIALTVHRLVTEALAEGSADLARAIIDAIEPDPVGSLPSVAQVIGAGLGFLDQQRPDAVFAQALSRAEPPEWEAESMRAARDIIGLARTADAFDQLGNLHRLYPGKVILEGTLLAVAGTIIALADLQGAEARDLAGSVLSE